MAINTNNIRAYGDILQRIYTAALGVAPPTLPYPQAVAAGFYDVGFIDETGMTETQSYNETKKYAWQGGGVVRTLRSQWEHPFKFIAIENNAVVQGLRFPTSTPVTIGGTAEVQTVTITGSPTGGTFTLSVPGFGSTPALTAGASLPTTAAVAAALTTLVGGTVTVTGTAGSSYVCTFPVSLGNIGQMTVTTAFTGGTTPAASVATGTPGVNGTNTLAVPPFVGRNLRQFVIDAVDLPVHERILLPNAEAVQTGDVTLAGTDITGFEFTCTPYPDALGNAFYNLNDDPARGSGLFV